MLQGSLVSASAQESSYDSRLEETLVIIVYLQNKSIKLGDL